MHIFMFLCRHIIYLFMSLYYLFIFIFMSSYYLYNYEDSSLSSSCFIISLSLSYFTSRHEISCRMSSREMAHIFTMVKLTESPQVAFSLQNLVKLITESTPRCDACASQTSSIKIAH